MLMKLDNGDKVVLETDKEKVVITSYYDGKISIEGYSLAKNVDGLLFEQAIKELEAKWMKEADNEAHKDWKEIERERAVRSIAFIKDYVQMLHERLHLDKTAIFNALERGRTYSYCNYYQASNFPSIPKIEELKEKISKLNKQIWDMKQEHEKEIISWQKKVSAAQGIFTKKREVKTSVEYGFDLWADCPYCDSYEKIDTSDYSHEGDFETNHECEKCGKIFSVTAEK